MTRADAQALVDSMDRLRDRRREMLAELTKTNTMLVCAEFYETIARNVLAEPESNVVVLEFARRKA